VPILFSAFVFFISSSNNNIAPATHYMWVTTYFSKPLVHTIPLLIVNMVLLLWHYLQARNPYKEWRNGKSPSILRKLAVCFEHLVVSVMIFIFMWHPEKFMEEKRHWLLSTLYFQILFQKNNRQQGGIDTILFLFFSDDCVRFHDFWWEQYFFIQ